MFQQCLNRNSAEILPVSEYLLNMFEGIYGTLKKEKDSASITITLHATKKGPAKMSFHAPIHQVVSAKCHKTPS